MVQHHLLTVAVHLSSTTQQPLHQPWNSVHSLNQVVDEVLPVAMVATLNVVQPLLVHTALQLHNFF